MIGTNWGSRMGLSRVAEDAIRKARGDAAGDTSRPLTAMQKILASTVSGGGSRVNARDCDDSDNLEL